MPATDTSAILAALRARMQSNTVPLHAYIINSDDAHQSEYMSAHDERRAFVTGFDGSAGTAVITADAALLWTDGRYYEQATQQMDANWRLMRASLADTPTIGVWLASVLQPGQAVGVDATLLATRSYTELRQELAENEVELCAVPENLVDAVWGDAQPAQTAAPIVALATAVTGRTVGDKVAQLRTRMAERRADVLVVTALDEVACESRCCCCFDWVMGT